ncbi:hypothetical protein QTN25_008022 [Entamoeba marina]
MHKKSIGILLVDKAVTGDSYFVENDEIEINNKSYIPEREETKTAHYVLSFGGNGNEVEMTPLEIKHLSLVSKNKENEYEFGSTKMEEDSKDHIFDYRETQKFEENESENELSESSNNSISNDELNDVFNGEDENEEGNGSDSDGGSEFSSEE